MSSSTILLPPFIPLRPLSRWATGLLLATAALAWVAVGVQLAQLRLLVYAVGGTRIALEVREAQTLTNSILLGAQLALFAATAVAFLLWLFQARANLRAFGARRLRYPRGWTVGGFAIPVLNLFRPYQVMREIWQASDPGSLDPFNWKSAPVPGLLLLWWGSFVAFASLEVVALVTDLGAGPNLAKLQLSTAITIVAHAAAAVSAGLACFVVGRISEAQEQKWEVQRERRAEAGAA